VPTAIGFGKNYLFDKPCVHQSDDVKKQAGIPSFVAYVANTASSCSCGVRTTSPGYGLVMRVESNRCKVHRRGLRQRVRYPRVRQLGGQRPKTRKLSGFTSRAFGNPQKALLLLSISHRWLNRLTCDIPSGDFPAGVRLTTFVRHLNEYFSTSAFGKGSGSERLSRARESFLGGWDVLVIFDFMSLPQVREDSLAMSCRDQLKTRCYSGSACQALDSCIRYFLESFAVTFHIASLVEQIDL
jgi:hypothetical protein